MKTTLFRWSCAALLLVSATSCRPEPETDVVPRPRLVKAQRGAYDLTRTELIVLSDPANPALVRLGELLAEDIERVVGRRPRVASPEEGLPAGVVRLILDGAPRTERDEWYRISVTEPSVRITAHQPVGLFYAMQTLRQLMPGPGEDPIISSVKIEDEPRFSYRGLHLDVARHFFPVPFIKRYIDTMAAFKFNTFHWHLTEDQGWRIEIKKYPRLTEIGSQRRETMVGKNFDPYVGDGTPYGGFYTQDQIRDVVAYAAERFVTIVPEIEMPGHSTAALAAYPELACTEGPFDVATTWGVFEDIYCPTEETFTFLQDVLAEVISLFPGPYVHVGGDEAPKARWEASPVARAVMDREGLADTDELQSYFIRRIERFLNENGRRLIGWDEILEGGLAPDATVMSWRGTEGGVEAARMGHDVIMTPTSHCYFDYYQADAEREPLAIGGFTPLEKVYSFEPVPEELNEAEAAHIIGAQGNVWTEYIKTAEHAEYMVYPRAIALSEVLWSSRHHRDLEDFVRRLPSQLAELEKRGVRYRPLDDPEAARTAGASER